MKRILPALLFFPLCALLVYCLERGPHDFAAADCVVCHRQGLPKDAANLTGPISLLCKKCHGKLFEQGYMHPYDMQPSGGVDIPGDMPLSEAGNMTCITCHDIHADIATPLGKRSYFLRRHEKGRPFCQTCHRGFARQRGGHQTSLGEAHFRSKYFETSRNMVIDPMSRNCLTCHDGAFASSVQINAGQWTHAVKVVGFAMTNHPIGVDYEAARLQAGRKTDLRPLGQVDGRLQFFEGRVGCGTCHNPYTQSQKHLVLENNSSMLCFSCHMLDR